MAKKGPDWLDDDDLFDDDDGGAFSDEAAAPAKRGGRDSAKNGGRDREKKRDRGNDEPPAKTARIGMRSQKRPGEQEVLKSPLVIGLAAGAVVLIIMSAAYWLIIGRDTTTKALMAIDEDLSNQRYAPAIKALEDFVITHSGHEKIEENRFKLSTARIDKEVTGSRTNWEEGIKMIDRFKKDNRDLETYDTQKPTLAGYGLQVTMGSIASAAKQPKDGRTFIEISKKAEARFIEFSDPDNPPKDQQAKIQDAREDAIDVIKRYEDLQAAYKKIDGQLKNNKPLEALKTRRELLALHADAEKLKDVRTRLEDSLQLEQDLVAESEVDIKASKEDRPLSVAAPLTLAYHTRSLTSEQQGKRRVFVVSQGTCYGVDTVTGDPIWRRTIGFDSPFFPMVVDTTIPGLLFFDTTYDELVLINRLTGEFAWRLPMPERVDGEPLVHDGQVYLPTQGNHLYKIDLQSGAAATRLKFSQRVHSPPVLTRDGEHLLIAGDEAVVYSLTVRPLECIRVSYTIHNPGTINVPLMKLGKMLLMIENRNAGNAVLRAFRASDPAEGITLAGVTQINSHVMNRPALRGNKLFVPGGAEQLNVYTVSDDIDLPPLAPLANPPGLTNYSYEGQVHLLPGSDDRLWTASDYTRSFLLEQDALKEKGKSLTKIGASGQPLQKIGTTLYVGKHLLASDAIGLVEMDGEDPKMPESWQTVLGSGVLAMTPTTAGGLLILNKSGKLFTIKEGDVTAAGFRHAAAGTLDISDDLKEPLRAATLPGNRIAVTRGGDKPRFWILNQAGKPAEDSLLEAAPVGDPVAMAGGALAVLPKKLKLSGIKGGSSVREYVGNVTNDPETQWSSVTPLDENHVIVVNQKGEITKLQYRTSPTKHLQPAESISLQTPIDFPPAIAAGKVFVVTPDGTLHMLNVVGFEKETSVKLPTPAVTPLKTVGNFVLVQTSDRKLTCFDSAKDLAKAWSIDMGSDAISGTPILEGDRIIFTTNNGAVLAIDNSGKTVGQLQLDSPIEHGPVKLGSLLIAISLDGSLYQVQSVLGDNK